MDKALAQFLSSSPLAEKIKLPGTIIVRETELSAQDVRDIKTAGVYGPVPKKGELCALEIGGQRVADGKIVKKRGEYYFKVTRINKEAEA